MITHYQASPTMPGILLVCVCVCVWGGGGGGGGATRPPVCILQHTLPFDLPHFCLLLFHILKLLQ